MNQTPPGEKPQRIEARPAREPAVRLFILAGLLTVFGVWLYVDGHVKAKYPYAPLAEDINAWAKWALNYWGPFVCIPAGAIVALLAVRFLRRRLVADRQGIGYRGKGQVPWGRITRVDASRLQSKGLLNLYAADSLALTLDSWKLENFRDLVAFVEDHVPASVISR